LKYVYISFKASTALHFDLEVTDVDAYEVILIRYNLLSKKIKREDRGNLVYGIA